jgi:two-component system OmpR family response regulator
MVLPPPGQDVLIVDDDVLIGALLMDLLREEGYSYRYVNCAADALAAIAAAKPAIILLDYWLPDMLGDEVLALLRGRGFTMPIAFITATPLAVQAVLDAHTVCLSKPFDLDAVVAWVGQYMHAGRRVDDRSGIS